MLMVFFAGNVGRDAEIRAVGNDSVCSFSVAVTKKGKGGETTQWLDASVWGKRGVALQPHIRKGGRVAVTGELSTREHNGKTYLSVRVSEIALMGGGAQGGSARSESKSSGGGYSDADYGAPADGSDDIPF